MITSSFETVLSVFFFMASALSFFRGGRQDPPRYGRLGAQIPVNPRPRVSCVSTQSSEALCCRSHGISCISWQSQTLNPKPWCLVHLLTITCKRQVNEKRRHKKITHACVRA
jgi:hypothetical protein